MAWNGEKGDIEPEIIYVFRDDMLTGSVTCTSEVDIIRRLQNRKFLEPKRALFVGLETGVCIVSLSDIN